jgi:hypothetical protein
MSTSTDGDVRDSHVLPWSRLARICDWPNCEPTSRPCELSIAWKSAVPSSDTEDQVLPASVERIKPRASGSSMSSAGG